MQHPAKLWSVLDRAATFRVTISTARRKGGQRPFFNTRCSLCPRCTASKSNGDTGANQSKMGGLDNVRVPQTGRPPLGLGLKPFDLIAAAPTCPLRIILTATSRFQVALFCHNKQCHMPPTRPRNFYKCSPSISNEVTALITPRRSLSVTPRAIDTEKINPLFPLRTELVPNPRFPVGGSVGRPMGTADNDLRPP